VRALKRHAGKIVINFDPDAAGAGLKELLTRAADVPDFPTLDATLIETQAKVRESFVRILGKAP